jgi:hypothetical protein
MEKLFLAASERFPFSVTIRTSGGKSGDEHSTRRM